METAISVLLQARGERRAFPGGDETLQSLIGQALPAACGCLSLSASMVRDRSGRPSGSQYVRSCWLSDFCSKNQLGSGNRRSSRMAIMNSCHFRDRVLYRSTPTSSESVGNEMLIVRGGARCWPVSCHLQKHSADPAAVAFTVLNAAPMVWCPLPGLLPAPGCLFLAATASQLVFRLDPILNVVARYTAPLHIEFIGSLANGVL